MEGKDGKQQPLPGATGLRGMFPTNWKDYIFPAALIAVLFVFYGNFEVSYSMANKISALVGIAVIAAVFLAGPLAFFWRGTFGFLLKYRKPWGLIGFWLITIHVLLSIVFYYGLDLGKFLAQNDLRLMAIALGGLSLAMLAGMVISSNVITIQRMGFEKWKAVQRAGYIGLLLAVMHFFLIELKTGNVFKVKPLGQVIFVFSVLVLFVKVASVFYSEYKGKGREKIE